MSLSQDKAVVGIVCEYNPFHKGHAWMIEKLRQKGAKTVVCVMSGPFVQRAEPACLPAHLRARAAVLGGADLVFRLPLPWAISSAEGFAYGAVGLLAALGCVDEIAFGAETANITFLQQLAALLGQPALIHSLRQELQSGGSFAAARAKVAESQLPGAAAVLRSPNNILAVEYCKALHRGYPALQARGLASLPSAQAVARLGAAHDGLPQSGIASASWLRAQAQKEGVGALVPYLPASGASLCKKAEKQGEWMDASRYELMLLSRLRGVAVEQLSGCPGAGEGLENRLFAAVRRAVSLEELYQQTKTKRYAHSRVRRLALSAALGVPQNLPAMPPFLHLMAASANGRELLKEMKHTAVLPLSASMAKLAKTGEGAARLVSLEAKAEDLYALCQTLPRPGGGAFTHPVQMLP